MQLTTLVNIMTPNHTCSKQFVSLFCGCESFNFLHEIDVPENLSLHLQARNKSLLIAMIARGLNDKNSDMDCHEVLPTDYKSGGDSMREQLCQQDPKQYGWKTVWEVSSVQAP